MKVDVLIIHYRDPRLTEQAVESALSSAGVETRVILVDNTAEGGWEQSRWNEDERVLLIANHRNLGFAAACNQGIEAALADGADALMLLNNDARLAPGALAILAEATQETGLAAPKILLPNGRLYAAGGLAELVKARARNRAIYRPDGGQFDAPEQMDFCSACALMIGRRVLASGVRFDEAYFLYYEDADYCLHLRRAGFRVAYEPRARVTHLESASTASHQSHRLDYFNARNRLRFLARNGRPWQWIAGGGYCLAVLAVRVIHCLVKGDRQRATATVRGVVDALTGRFGPGPYIDDARLPEQLDR